MKPEELDRINRAEEIQLYTENREVKNDSK